MSGAGITAEGLGMQGPRGPVFTDVRFTAAPGSLVALEGPSGSGRTCLLLTLTGRMRPTGGRAEVDGHPLPKRMAAVRRIAGLGPVPGVTDLDPALTVAEQLRERALLRRWFRGRRLERATERRARIDRALRLAGLDLDALSKGPRTTVRNLERLEELRLGVALALLDEPRLLAVDDLDLKLSDPERTEAWALLRSLTEEGLTVLAVCSEAPADALVVRTDTPTATDEDTDPETVPAAPGTDQAPEPDSAPARAVSDQDVPAAGADPADRPDRTDQTRHGEATDDTEDTGRADRAEDTDQTDQTDHTAASREEGTEDAFTEARRA